VNEPAPTPAPDAEPPVVVADYRRGDVWLVARGMPGETFEELARFLRELCGATDVLERKPE
jgi:hypothetical protein